MLAHHWAADSKNTGMLYAGTRSQTSQQYYQYMGALTWNPIDFIFFAQRWFSGEYITSVSDFAFPLL